MANNTVELIIKAQDLASKELKNINKQVKWIQWTIKTTWSNIKEFWKRNKETFKNIWIWAGVAATAILVMWKKFLDLSTQIEQTQKKANIVFWDYIDWVKDIAKETASSMWLSQNEYLNAAAGLQDLLIPMWFARDEATKLTTDTIALSWALSEWSAWQYTATQAAEILAKAYLWETEQLKSMGISINAAEISARVLENAQKGIKWSTDSQSRALAIQKLILEKSTDAQDAFKKWWGSLARQQAELEAKIKDTRDAIAIWLTPVMYKLLDAIKPQLEQLAKNSEEWFKNKENIKKFETTMDSAIIVIKWLWKFLMLLVKSWLLVWKAIWFVVSDVVIKLSRLKELWPDMFEWGKNAIEMFTKWIKDWIGGLANVMELWAQTIKDYIWFQSPTKKWPWSWADKWMPNLINMLTVWLNNGAQAVANAAEKIWDSIAWWIDSIELKNVLEDVQRSAASAFWALKTQIKDQKSTVQWLVAEYKELKKQIKDINLNIKWIQQTWQQDIATRAVELQNQLQEDLTSEKRKQLREELKLAKNYVTNQEIQQARIELEKTETQKIVERVQMQVQEAQAEKARLMELAALKKAAAIDAEHRHRILIQSKKNLDIQYFNLFSTRVRIQWNEINNTINKMQRLLDLSSNSSSSKKDRRAIWWPVSEWKSYLVWERWPEVFTPSWGGRITANNKIWWAWNITVNMWGVSVSNEADENRLVDKLKKALINEAKLFNLWIS